MRKKKSRADMRTDNRKFSPRAMEAFTNLVFAAHELSVRIPLDYHGNSLEEMKQWEMKLTEKSKDELKEFLYEIVMDRYKTGNRDLNIFTDLLEEFPNYDEVNNQIHESGSLHKVIKEWVVHLEPNDRVRLFVYQLKRILNKPEVERQVNFQLFFPQLLKFDWFDVSKTQLEDLTSSQFIDMVGSYTKVSLSETTARDIRKEFKRSN